MFVRITRRPVIAAMEVCVSLLLCLCWLTFLLDSCIYLHDRGDYKTGWQLEKEWELHLKEKKEAEGLRLIFNDRVYESIH